jgi:hypothetical protein
MPIQNRRLQPLPVIKGFVSVRTIKKIKSGLECDQWLQRKLTNTVLMQFYDLYDKRRAVSEIVVAGLCDRMFSAFVYVCVCCIGLEIETGFHCGQWLL